MAGAMRKMGIYLGLVEDEHAENGEYEGEYTDDSDYGDYEPEPAPVRREVAPTRTSVSSTLGSSTSSWSDHSEHVSSPRTSTPSSSQVLAAERPTYTARSYSSSRSTLGGLDTTVEPEVSTEQSSLARIITLHPRTYNEARVIGEQFRDGVPVIMNLTEMDDSDAKRLVDFAAGLTFGLRGSIDRVTNRVFLLSPQNVNVTAEDKARLAEGGFFNQS